ncbi:MAG TPA: SLC13 family permease [Halanaerobiales bacterium]|nr:SLC13 family permease [Halanaerobiales bacterium]
MTLDILLTLLVLLVTIVLFITEAFRIDIISIIIMISLGWLGIIEPGEIFSGFASNAVISVIAVMILGYGLDRSGIMKKLVRPIIKLAGTSEKRLIAVISASAGITSAFMQNIGATALFLPAVTRISKKINISLSRLLMPIGFAAILGGTLTMVASGPLIILNDLLRQGNQEPFSLLSVTPLGFILLFSGIIYFVIFGNKILPSKDDKEKDTQNIQKKLIETWELPTAVYHCRITEESGLVGENYETSRLWPDFNLNLLVLKEEDDILYAPWRYTRFAAGQQLILLGEEKNISEFAAAYGLKYEKEVEKFQESKWLEDSAFAEMIIPPRSEVNGKTLREIELRKNLNINPITLLRGEQVISDDFSDIKLKSGDTMIVYGLIENLQLLDKNEDFILVTHLIDTEKNYLSKSIFAILAFMTALILVLLGFKLSLSLFTGALIMIFMGVIPPDEIYKAVDWKTVFLLAGLIPLGIAMDNTGTASYIANQIMLLMQGSHSILILFAIAVLTTLFTLFMSNVAATVVLVPLVMIIGERIGINPRGLALLVAVCASNSFVLPTHQVNALLMTPGGYHNKDYLKAGGFLTIIFIIFVVGFVYLFYVK